MKQNLPMPVIVGIVALVLVVVAFFFVKGVTAEPKTPRPPRSQFMTPNDFKGTKPP